jgi:hypothetical protein
LPILQIFFGVVEDLSSLRTSTVRRAVLSGDDGLIIEKLEKTAAVLSEDDLLLGALDGGQELGFVGFLELLTSLLYTQSMVGQFTVQWSGGL